MQTMVCERCGNEITQSASICSICGTVQARAGKASRSNTVYGPYGPYTEPSSYQREFPPQAPPYSPQQNFGYASAYHQAAYTHAANPIQAPFAQEIVFSNKNDSALIAEVILSLFGLFGVGWLMAGETAIGIVFLLASVFIYWPFVILGTILTLGFGVICLGPLAIGVIILNTLLLNRTLNRRATRFFVPRQHAQSYVPPQQ